MRSECKNTLEASSILSNLASEVTSASWLWGHESVNPAISRRLKQEADGSEASLNYRQEPFLQKQKPIKQKEVTLVVLFNFFY